MSYTVKHNIQKKLIAKKTFVRSAVSLAGKKKLKEAEKDYKKYKSKKNMTVNKRLRLLR